MAMSEFNPVNATFAAYANQARHNLSLVFNDIAQKAGLHLSKDEESDEQLSEHLILKRLHTPNKARQEARIIRGLEKAFPFITPLSRAIMDYADEDERRPQPSKTQQNTLLPAQYARLFKDAAWLLHQLRNSLTHAGQPLPELEPGQVRLTEKLFDAAVRSIKVRHQYAEADMKHLRRRISNPRHFRHNKDQAQEEKSIANPDFKSLTDQQGRFTQEGMVFFLCLFLSRHEGYQLLQQIPGFKDERNQVRQAKPRVFTRFYLHLPHARLDTQTPTNPNTLALDMIGELARCPQELYERLPPREQTQYQISPDEQAETDAFPSRQEAEGNDGENTLLFIRHQERFTPLMLNYLEQSQAFQKLGFQVDLGDFYFAAYPKTLYTHDPELRTEEIRRLKKKVLTFAHLNTLAAWPKPQVWQALERTNCTEDHPGPYIVKTQPHYHLPDDNIALGQINPDAIYPNLEEKPDAPEKRYIPPTNPKPDFYLSRHELAPLCFYQMLQKKHGRGTRLESLLFQYQSAIKAVFADIRENKTLFQGCVPDLQALDARLAETPRYHYGDPQEQSFPLVARNLPEVLQHYLLGRSAGQSPLQQAHNTLALLQEDTRHRLKHLKRQTQAESRTNRNRPGDARQRLPKAGNMADFLARDILRLQPAYRADDPRKAGSLLFAELQTRLAFYGRDKAMLPQLCRNMGLIESENPHPFLAELLQRIFPGTIGFYKAYLEQRQSYLEAIRNTLRTEEQLASCSWLPQRETPREYEAVCRHIDKLGETPINLPRSLFLAPCLHILRQIENAYPGLKAALQGMERFNGTYLVQLYYANVLDDGHPGVYDLPRNYKVIDQVYDARKDNELRNPLPQQYVYTQPGQTIPDPRGKVLDQERLKRWSSTLPTQGEQKRRGRMPGVQPTPEQLLHSRKAACLDFYESEKDLRQIRTQDQVLFMAAHSLLQGMDIQQGLKELKLRDMNRNILSTYVPYQLELYGKTITVEQVRLKHLGQFRHLLKDRRLPGLLTYYPGDQIRYEDLKQELEIYQQCRLAFFTGLLQFETQVLLHDGQPSEQAGSLHGRILDHYFKHHPHPAQETRKSEMLVLRNAFCLQLYPVLESEFTLKYPLARPMLKEALSQLREPDAGSVARWFAEKARTLYAYEPGRTMEKGKPRI